MASVQAVRSGPLIICSTADYRLYARRRTDHRGCLGGRELLPRLSLRLADDGAERRAGISGITSVVVVDRVLGLGGQTLPWRERLDEREQVAQLSECPLDRHHETCCDGARGVIGVSGRAGDGRCTDREGRARWVVAGHYRRGLLI